jgi:flagellar protein FlaG
MAIHQISGPGNVPQPAQTKPAEQKAGPAPESHPGREQVQQVAQQLRRIAEPVAQNLQFTVDGDTGKTVIRVVDGATKEVIRQIPNEEVLAITRALDRLQGLLIKSKA